MSALFVIPAFLMFHVEIFNRGEIATKEIHARGQKQTSANPHLPIG